jgi:hypothetical protein
MLVLRLTIGKKNFGLLVEGLALMCGFDLDFSGFFGILCQIPDVCELASMLLRTGSRMDFNLLELCL